MPAPIRAVLFDLHQTLVDGGDTRRWIAAARRRLDTDGGARHGDSAPLDGLATWLDDVWVHASRIDPDARRDLDGDTHRQVFIETVMTYAPGADRELATVLYDTMPDALTAYDDAVPVLAALAGAGVRCAVLSNIGFDVRPLLDRAGLRPHVDAVVLSFEVGCTKPDPAIFQLALDRIEVRAEETLMVGDSWRDDAGAAALGIRTLVLPRTRGPVHGLAAVRRLVGC